MASIFANNRILPNLGKRRSRPTNKTDVVSSPIKGPSKVLHILPNVAEEDEYPSRPSTSSISSLPITSSYQPSRFYGSSATLGARPIHDKRDSRRVVLTGVEGLTFDDFFPPCSAPRTRTPSPPPRPVTPPRSNASSPTSESSRLDDINLRFSGLGISLDFPSPPSSATPLASPFSRREQSPSPSVASSDTSSSPKTPCSTPPTSDDDEFPSKSNLMRAPTFKSQRASVLFMKSMPDLAETMRKASITSLVDEDISEEVDWIARDISDIITLASPIPPVSPLSPTNPSVDLRARPDSMPPPPRRGRSSKMPPPPLPRISIQDSSARGPSAQLDPTFPLNRRSYLIPTRPPPPPPVPMPKSPSLSSMEQATEELLAELANAALGAGFKGTELTVPRDVWSTAGSAPPSPSSQFIVTTPVSPCPSSLRPLPRSSIPADIDDFCESPIELSVPKREQAQWPTTPQSSISVYSQMSDSTPASPLSSFDFDIDVSYTASASSHGPSSFPASESPSSSSPMRRSPSTHSMGADPERALRSRWSTSTLGSLAESHSHSWLPRFTLSPSKKAKASKAHHQTHAHSGSASSTSSTAAGSTSPLQRKNAVKGAHVAKRSMESEHGVTRRDSRSSRVSTSSASDSGESAMSAGLRRKPIPIALLTVQNSN